ncbi:MAG: S-layer homology domain-containing protein [Clostridia bacterium]|nr:S-layer homology domain-containing protein [Clostridia bacterium]
MKKVILLILVFVTLFMLVPNSSYTLSAADQKPIYSPASLSTTYLFPSNAYAKAVYDTDEYLRFTLAPGTYDGNSGLIEFGDNSLKLYEYPYLKFEYRTDSTADIIDLTIWTSSGESWPGSHPKNESDGTNWETVVFDLGQITKGAEPAMNEYGSVLRFKPWGTGSRTLTQESFFDIKYLAFFKTEQEAINYVYDSADDTHLPTSYPTDPDIIKDGTQILDTLNDEFDALAEKITRSPTNVTVTGTSYYVSKSGNDTNDGLTPETAWKTIKKVDSYSFAEGDGVFFKRGDQFRADGTTLTLQSGVTYSAYGSGDKPVFVGSQDAANPYLWEETDTPNVYRYTKIIHDCGCIVFNGGECWGIKVTKNPKDPNGYSYDSATVSNGRDEPFVSGGKEYNGYISLENNLEFTNYNNSLYLYCNEGNPGDVFSSIELSPGIHGVNGTVIENVIFDNIKLVGYGNHGISTQDVTNFTVQNCIFGWIGGSTNSGRFGNAVQNWKNADGFVIDSCWAYQVYDCCYTTQFTGDVTEDVYIRNVEFKNNLAEYSNSGPEIWNNDKKNDTYIHYDNVKVYNNYVRNGGYGWSHQRPNKDGNFYYGAFEAPGHSWNDFKAYDNKFFICYKYGLLSRYISENNAWYNGNLYVIGEDKYFAKSAFDPLDPTRLDFEYPYTPESLAKLQANGVEQDGEFYSVPASYVPEPFDYESVKDIYTEKMFADSADHWAEKYILNVLRKGYFNGISDIEFAPENTMTRGMFFTVLSRFDTTETPRGDKWYDGAVSWAVDNGYTTEENARPDASITRAELAVIISRYFSDNYISANGESKIFTDESRLSNAVTELSDYDLDELTSAIDFCVKAGIIDGYDDGSFRADAFTTRAQVAAIFTRMDDFLADCVFDTQAAIENGDIFTIDADDLYEILNDSRKSSTKSLLEENGTDFVRFIPSENKQGTVQIDLHQNKLNGIDFYKLKYMKVKYRIDFDPYITENRLDVGLRWPAEQWLFPALRPFIRETGTWHSGLVCYDDFNASSVDLPNQSLDTYFYTFKPWGNNVQLNTEHYFDIEEIVFFDDPIIAKAFKFD